MRMPPWSTSLTIEATFPIICIASSGRMSPSRVFVLSALAVSFRASSTVTGRPRCASTSSHPSSLERYFTKTEESTMGISVLPHQFRRRPLIGRFDAVLDDLVEVRQGGLRLRLPGQVLEVGPGLPCHVDSCLFQGVYHFFADPYAHHF